MTETARRVDESSSPAPIRVMIVDDSMAARTMTRRALTGDTAFEVVASVAGGQAAIETVETVAPDILLLDVEMPVMNGIDALPRLLAKRPALKVVILAPPTLRDPEIGLKAIRAGAVDIVETPPPGGGPDVQRFEAELRRILRDIGQAASPQARVKRPVPPQPMVRRPSAKPIAKVEAIAIGSSTGGPQALAKVLDAWGAKGLDQPIFITQHMPPTFTSILAEHLTRSSGIPAAEGRDGEAVTPKRIYIAPGNWHMLVERSGGGLVIRLNDGPQVNFCRPAVDPMFDSLAQIYRDRLAAVVLTGMGRDGRDGARAIQSAGGRVIVQDEATSVVWGMPGAVANAGFADEILPIDKIAPALTACAKGGPGR